MERRLRAGQRLTGPLLQPTQQPAGPIEFGRQNRQSCGNHEKRRARSHQQHQPQSNHRGPQHQNQSLPDPPQRRQPSPGTPALQSGSPAPHPLGTRLLTRPPGLGSQVPRSRLGRPTPGNPGPGPVDRVRQVSPGGQGGRVSRSIGGICGVAVRQTGGGGGRSLRRGRGINRTPGWSDPSGAGPGGIVQVGAFRGGSAVQDAMNYTSPTDRLAASPGPEKRGWPPRSSLGVGVPSFVSCPRLPHVARPVPSGGS